MSSAALCENFARKSLLPNYAVLPLISGSLRAVGKNFFEKIGKIGLLADI